MWAIILCFSCVFLIFEMFIPGMFFLNFAIAAAICSVISLFTTSFMTLAICFCVLSVLLLYTLRPLLVKNEKDKKQQSGIEAKYIGKNAKVIEKIDKKSGVISIYDERWQARTKGDEVIEAGEEAKIIGYESIIMFVEKA